MQKSVETLVSEILGLFEGTELTYEQMSQVIQLANIKIIYNQKFNNANNSIDLNKKATPTPAPYTEGAANEQADWTPPKPE